MIGKKWNFYVKKMQKFGIVLLGVLWTVIFLSGCTRKDEAQMMLLTMEEEQNTEPETAEAESDTEEKAVMEVVKDSVSAEEPSREVQKLQEESTSGLLYVHVCGAVLNPGVYELPTGSRVYEAVEQAGGFAEDAAKDYVNQAQQIPDAAKIVIPTLQEVDAVREDGSGELQYGILLQESAENGRQLQRDEYAESGNKGLININTASKTELCTLPGIGDVKADAIISYRAQIGCFTSKEQIMEIDGIKDSLYSKIQNKICVE